MNQLLTLEDEVGRRTWTREEYHRLGELGLFVGQRVQLIHGEVLKMPPMKDAHRISIGLTGEALGRAFGPGHWVCVQLPLNLSDVSEPEPDLAVVKGGPRDHPTAPDTALLVVEINDTTLRFDRRVKAPLYAAAGVPEYWVVNLRDRELDVMRQPGPDPDDPATFRYADVTVHDDKSAVAPLAAPDSPVQVADLLP